MPDSAPRLRQAVIAVRDLDACVTALRENHGLGEPYNDPAVAHFGLRNAVFAIGDTFLELVSPVEDGTAAGRMIDRRGGDCGYMAMLQVEDVGAARGRASELGVSEVFEIELDDIAEAHLHPREVGGAIVSISEPRPPQSWRWGGDGWRERSVPGRVASLRVAVPDPDQTERLWTGIAGGEIPVQFEPESSERAGIVEIVLELDGRLVKLDPRRLCETSPGI